MLFFITFHDDGYLMYSLCLSVPSMLNISLTCLKCFSTFKILLSHMVPFVVMCKDVCFALLAETRSESRLITLLFINGSPPLKFNKVRSCFVNSLIFS